LVQGKIAQKQQQTQKNQLTIINYLLQDDLQKAICASETVICRSGYTSIMDLNCLQKKVFFIPTSGQTEQEYLAKHLEQLHIAPYATQDTFCLKDLEKLQDFTGFTKVSSSINWQELFQIFE